MKKGIILILMLSIFILSSCTWFTKKEEEKNILLDSVKINPIGGEAKGEENTTISKGNFY